MPHRRASLASVEARLVPPHRILSSAGAPQSLNRPWPGNSDCRQGSDEHDSRRHEVPGDDPQILLPDGHDLRVGGEDADHRRGGDMAQQGEWNVGQLVRERVGREAVLVGFSTYEGTVTAASNWDEPPRRKRVRPALAESFEALFHSLELPGLYLGFRGGSEHLLQALRQPRLERAIGVIYRPETERLSHYFRARLSDQFDALVHFDETRAVEPLERVAGWDRGEVPETYPMAV